MHPVPERWKLALQFVALLTSCVLGCSIQVQAQQNMEIGILRDGSLTQPEQMVKVLSSRPRWRQLSSGPSSHIYSIIRRPLWRAGLFLDSS